MNTDIKTIQLNEKYSIKNAIASTIVLNASTNYFPLFAIGVLGATNYQVSLINSLPQFIGMFGVIICSVLMGRLEEKKKFTSFSIFFTRIFVLLMFLVMYIPKEYQSWVFVLLVGLMNFPGSFANLSWQSLIGDLIPEERRSNFFGERNKILTIVGMIATFIIGIALQQFSKSNSLPYKFLFLFAFISGMVEVYYLNKHIEKKQEVKKYKKPLKIIDWTAFREKPFIYYLICGLFFNFAWQMAWPLFSIYQIKDAHANGLWVSIINVANQLAQIISFKWWGRMADKYSNARMMVLVSLGMASTPVLTILSKNLFYLTIVNTSSGLFVSGTVLLLFNQLLEITNEDNRSSYIANYNILLSIIGFVAPQCGVFLLDFSNMNISMIIAGILRASSAFFFLMFFYYLQKKKNQSQSLISHFD